MLKSETKMFLISSFRCTVLYIFLLLITGHINTHLSSKVIFFDEYYGNRNSRISWCFLSGKHHRQRKQYRCDPVYSFLNANSVDPDQTTCCAASDPSYLA